MSWFTQDAINDIGQVQAVTSGTVTSTVGAQGYVGSSPLVSTDSPEASDVFFAGLRYSAAGAMRIYDASSALPATSYSNGGMRVTPAGQLCITTATVSGSDLIYNGGIGTRNDGAVYMSTGGGGAYTGPLDLVPGAALAVGQRALKSADLGTAIYTITENYDNASQSFNSDATTGVAPIAAIEAFNPGSFTHTGNVITDDKNITLDSAAHVAVGQGVSGTDIPVGSIVTDVSGAPTIRISASPTGDNAAETLTFTPNLRISTWNNKSGNAINITGDTPDGCGWEICSENSLPGLAGSFAGTLATTPNSISISAASPLSWFIPVFIEPATFCGIRVILNGVDFVGLCRFDVDESSIFLRITDTEAVSTDWEASGTFSGLHIFEVHIDAAGAVDILMDGVSVGATITSGVQQPLPAMTAALQLQGNLDQTTDELRIFEPILYLSSLSSGNKTSIRQNQATYYNITLP